MSPSATGMQSSGLDKWLAAAAALLVGGIVFALWFWLLPGWLGFQVENGTAHWRWLAAIPSVLGFAVAMRCVWDFGWKGRGTPAPFIPPQRLVVTGFYRYVRNPMYVGLVVTSLGIAVIVGSLPMFLVPVLVFSTANWGHIPFEEAKMRRQFGAAYDAYTGKVRRWL